MDTFIGRKRRLRSRFLLVSIGLAVLGSVAAAWAEPPSADASAPADEAFAARGPSYDKVPKPVRPTPAEKAGLDLAGVPEVRLKALDTEALLREDAKADRAEFSTKVLRYGVGRDVQVAAEDGHWYDLPGGKRLWTAEIASTDALGVRLHFRDMHLPAGAELAVYAPAASDPGRGVVKLGSPRFDPDRYVEFYTPATPLAQRGELWTGTFFGETARIEYLAPAAAGEELPFTVDRLQHLYRDPVAAQVKSLAKAAGACENDVSCFPDFADTARAVSGIGFVGSNSLYCTGQLLNTSGKQPDFTPYWLTANHCLSDQVDADSAEFFWLYQTASCGGPPPSISSVPRSRGATLLSTNPLSDYTLLLIEGALPGDLVWAGWTSKEPGNGTDAVAIHHPSGDFKRISFGFKESGNTCSQFAGFGGRKLVRTSWTNAVTERGSSGSGVFRQDTQQLYGQLLGGPSACGVPPEDLFDCYGSFATTYTKIKKLLKGGSDDRSEQNDTCPRARVVKAGTLGSRIVKITDEDWYKVSVKPGKAVTVDLAFSDANGDIDLQAFGACNQPSFAESTGTEDGESLSIENVGRKPAFVFFRVFLADDTRNSYNLSVSFH